MMALGLCSLLTLAPMMNLNAQAEQEPLRGSVMKSEEHQNPSINPDDIKTLEEGSKLEMTLTTTMSTSSVTQGDEFFAKISKDYSVDGKVVIPRGSLIHGTIGEAKAPGLAGRKAYMTTNFDYLITPDGREIPIEGKYSNKDGGVKRAAKVVARTAGFGAVGGVAGAVMGLKYAGIGSAIAGIFTTMITYTFFPTQGFGYLLLALAAVFVGGTPYWGGLGTIIGAVFGVGIIAYMEIGIIAIGWSGEWRQFFNGLIILLALLGHRLHGERVR